MKTSLKKVVLSFCMLSQLSLGGCAPAADKVQPKYVSPLQYQGYSCNQIRQEMMIVSRHVSDVSGTQDHQANNDSAAMGVGLILFWPALFFLANKDDREELGRLKGEYEALEEAAVKKNCSVGREIEAARKMEGERRAAQAKQNAPSKNNNSHD
jgi:hypothetical protein